MRRKKIILPIIQKILQFNFGKFEGPELKKFVRMGLIFGLVIGVYWTLRPLKDAVFIQFVDRLQLPAAKIVSVITLLPLVMFYTRLLERFSREKMLVILPAFYGIVVLCFSALMPFLQMPKELIALRTPTLIYLTMFLGYLWYVFVESFGSLMVALFWAFASDTTEPTSAKRGFPLIVAFGQLGGILFPYSIGGLPHRLGLTTDSLSMAILGLFIFVIILLVRYFLRVTPAHLLKSYSGRNEEVVEKAHEPGFFEGLRLLLRHKYLLGIFGINFIYEFIVTMFDFNFKLAASDAFTGVALSNYLSIYGSSVNIVSLACLLLGISNVTRFLGVGVALSAMPIIVAGALIGFLSLDTLTFLFALMVGSKAINYALNGPAIKQLYIPTSPDARFKAQAWIETFGSRTSKQSASIFNLSLAPLQNALGAAAGRTRYLFLSGMISFPLIVFWLVITVFLGLTFRRAVNGKNTIC